MSTICSRDPGDPLALMVVAVFSGTEGRAKELVVMLIDAFDKSANWSVALGFGGLISVCWGSIVFL